MQETNISKACELESQSGSRTMLSQHFVQGSMGYVQVELFVKRTGFDSEDVKRLLRGKNTEVIIDVINAKEMA